MVMMMMMMMMMMMTMMMMMMMMIMMMMTMMNRKKIRTKSGKTLPEAATTRSIRRKEKAFVYIFFHSDEAKLFFFCFD